MPGRQARGGAYGEVPADGRAPWVSRSRRGREVAAPPYGAGMDLQPVRAAYASLSEQYVALVEGPGPVPGDDADLLARHLTGLAGPVLDLGCGPGQWSAHLHALGADVTGVDLVPAFVAHARAVHPGPAYRLGSMTGLDVADHTVAGVLAWYSTIHVPPAELDGVLAGFRRLLAPGGVLVVGFFDSGNGVAAFDHAVTTAWRWPVDEYARRLAAAGFVEVERQQQRHPTRADRRYAAIAAHAA